VLSSVLGRASASGRSRQLRFAVVDVETTGLFARANDRVVEIAIVRVDAEGRRLDEYATLVNPDRDLGSTEIHGIRGRDVAAAPRFEEILGDVSTRLRGHVLVAHNARFDRDFLEAEFRRCGYSFPQENWLCTMELGRAATGARRLGACCEVLGIRLETAHCAADDAAAAAALLVACLGDERVAAEVLPRLRLDPAPLDGWPGVPPCERCVHRGAAATLRTDSAISRLLDRLPDVSEAAAADARTAYLELLDRALEDRRLTAAEVASLHDVAVAWGLGREMVGSLHERYFGALLTLAREDGVVTAAERADLQDVASLLGLDASTAAVSEERELAATPARREQFTGASVCFTGASTCSIDGEEITRERAELLARARGLVVKPSVTKALDLLVVADADSLSGKARKARDYGTRIMVERAFWHALGVEID